MIIKIKFMFSLLFVFFCEGNTEDELSIVVDQEDFMVALESLVPSVSEQELQHYQQIQNQISRGF